MYFFLYTSSNGYVPSLYANAPVTTWAQKSKRFVLLYFCLKGMANSAGPDCNNEEREHKRYQDGFIDGYLACLHAYRQTFAVHAASLYSDATGEDFLGSGQGDERRQARQTARMTRGEDQGRRAGKGGKGSQGKTSLHLAKTAQSSTGKGNSGAASAARLGRDAGQVNLGQADEAKQTDKAGEGMQPSKAKGSKKIDGIKQTGQGVQTMQERKEDETQRPMDRDEERSDAMNELFFKTRLSINCLSLEPSKRGTDVYPKVDSPASKASRHPLRSSEKSTPSPCALER